MATATVTEETSTLSRQIELEEIQITNNSIHHTTSDENVNDHQQSPSTLDPAGLSEEEYPKGVQLWLTVLTIASVLILGALDINIVATAVPTIVDEFHSIADVGWYSSAFRLCTCAFQFMFGRLYKHFPVKRVFMCSNALFLLSSILCATANSSAMFIFGRAVSGLGFAGVLSGLYAFKTFPPRHRPLFIGIICGIESMAIAAAPIIGGALTQSLGWRWCFWINLPIAGATLFIMLFLPDPTKMDEYIKLPLKRKILELDLLSNLLFIPGLTCLFLALAWAGVKFSWHDGRIIGLFVTFGVLLAGFLYNQHRRGDSAALPPRVLRKRNVVAGLIFGTCVNSVLNVLQYYLPTYYQVVRGYAPAKSGYMIIPVTIGDSIGAILHGLGTTVWGYYTPFMLVASIGMPVFAGLITTFGTATNFAQLILYSAFAGFSTGIGYMGPQNAALTTLNKEDAPLGIAIILFGTNFGPAVFVAIAQVIFTNRLSANLASTIPGSNGTEIESGGFSHILDQVPMDHRAAAISGISESLSETWYLAVALGATTIVGSLSMEWRSVKQKKS